MNNNRYVNTYNGMGISLPLLYITADTQYKVLRCPKFYL